MGLSSSLRAAEMVLEIAAAAAAASHPKTFLKSTKALN
jgi:hypothetical protein